jgi:hypothetical protein
VGDKKRSCWGTWPLFTPTVAEIPAPAGSAGLESAPARAGQRRPAATRAELRSGAGAERNGVDGGSTRGGVEASSRVRAGAARSADAVVLSPRPRLPHETRRGRRQRRRGWVAAAGGRGWTVRSCWVGLIAPRCR